MINHYNYNGNISSQFVYMTYALYSFNIEETKNKRVICYACLMVNERKNRAIIKIEINSEGSIPLCKRHFEQYSVSDVMDLLDGSINF